MWALRAKVESGMVPKRDSEFNVESEAATLIDRVKRV